VSSVQEIAALRKEAFEFGKVRSILRSQNAEEGEAAKMAFQKVIPIPNYTGTHISHLLGYEQVFHSDILNLLSMPDMWRTRVPPTPLDFDSILDGNFVVSPKSRSNARPIKNLPKQARANGSEIHESDNGELPSTSSSGDDADFKDQRKLSLRDNLELFISRFVLTSPFCFTILETK
jgi:ubiquitin-like 1-activating enzyme E1 B